MEEYDVIIVGAGPAGLIAAHKTAKDGLNVLLLDKKQELGVPKRCAEGLALDAIIECGLEKELDKSWALQGISGAVVYSPAGKKVEVLFPKISGYILERRVFEKMLAKRAARAGAKILVKSHVHSLERKNGKVIVTANYFGENIQFEAPLIMACDGVDSLTARRLGLNTTNKLNDIDSGFQYEMAGIDFPQPNLLHLWFGNDIAPRGYIWLFPKGEHEANVGIGIGGLAPQKARYYLDKWIQTMPGIKKGSIIEVNAGAIPVGGFLEDMTVDNLLVCGDAAHQVNPIHGGGIGLAMEASLIVAEVAKQAHAKKDFSNQFLQKYNNLWYAKRGNELKKVLKVRHMMEKLSDKDFEYLVGKITGEELLKIAEADFIQTAKIVTKKFVQNPGLMKIMLDYVKS